MQNENNTRKFDVSFPRQIAVVVLLSALLSAYPLFAFASAEVIRACIAGVTISLANVLAGYAAIEYSIDKSYTVFLKAVLGGMGLRMLAMLGALLMLIEVFHFQAVPLVVSLMGFYVLFLDSRSDVHAKEIGQENRRITQWRRFFFLTLNLRLMPLRFCRRYRRYCPRFRCARRERESFHASLKHVQDAHELETPFGRIELPHLHLSRDRHVDNEARCLFMARRSFARRYPGNRCTEK